MARNLRTKYFKFEGGLDLVTPPLSIPPGRLLGCQNYEIGVETGYKRIEGYERYDGNPKPSDASYWILNFDSGSVEITEDETVTGAGGATGVALLDAVLESGNYGGGDAAGYIVLYGVSGTFVDNESFDGSAAGAGVGTVNGVALERGASTSALDTTYIRDAIETTRGDISVVPGSGNMRGVWIYNNVVYAFRDNALATAGDMYKSSSSGWTLCVLGFTIDFDAGTTAFTVDDTLTGGTSAATGTIKKVVVESGTWAGNDAEGYVVLYSKTGIFQNNETITDTSGGSATADGVGSDNELSASGRYEFVNYNFGSQGASSTKMYGVNGVDKAFEWDGSTFSFIPTGMATDTPDHIAAHTNHLFLSFTGGSLQYSGIQDPTSWTLLAGANEIAIGDEITGLLPVSGHTLAIFARNSTYIMTGTSSADFTIKAHSRTSGAIEWSIQSVQEPMYLDDRGLTYLSRTDDFGDFNDNIISNKVQRLLDSRKDGVTASVAVKNKNQYIIYFDDNSAMQCTIKDRKVKGFMDLDLDLVVRCTASGEDSNGDEQIFFGSDDGYIYQLNKGTSFDGSAIVAFLRFAYNHCGSPQYWKRFRRITMELDELADPNMSLQFAPDFSYGDPDIPTTAPSTNYTLKAGGGYWDSALWNTFYWTGQVVGTWDGYIEGDGVNISLLINSSATYDPVHTLNGATLHYFLKGMKR